jgi:hypothetical protein
VDVHFKQIEPLSIVKQLLTGALAACDFSPSEEAVAMRRTVLNPNESTLLRNVRVFTYLNPTREGEEEDAALTTKRVCWNLPLLDFKSGRSSFTFAEYAHCPLGYVVLLTAPPFGMSLEAEKLADLTNFTSYHWREKVDLDLRIPVRNAFGPVSCHFANLKGGGKWFGSDEDAKAGSEMPRARRSNA